MNCHAFSVAGTVYPDVASPANAGIAGVTVVVVDANGAITSLTSNAAGNFYTSAPLARPLQSDSVIRGTTTTRMVGAPQGAFSSCHALPPSNSAAGRVHALDGRRMQLAGGGQPTVFTRASPLGKGTKVLVLGTRLPMNRRMGTGLTCKGVALG